LPEYYIFDNIYLPPGFLPDDPVHGGGNGGSPVTPIPLPATGWLLVAAVGGLAMARRKASTAPGRSSV
ncbi:MAG: VPLPA-CTERM sorting domain-containing protein, partial [Pseudomonadota bacterium]